MKKTVLIISTLFLLLSCSKNQNKNDRIIEITERMFLGQVNDIYLNTGDYLSKKIQIQGIFLNEEGTDDYEPFYAVFRYGPGGCCGIDGFIGFEVKWTGSQNKEYPENDSWVEAVGELKEYKEEMYSFLYIDLISLNVLDERGREYIIQ